MSKVRGLGSDGASVTTGHGKGVAGMMKIENPGMVKVHCIAHTLALCTRQTAQGVTALDAFQQALTSIYYYFKYSPKKAARMAEVNAILDLPQLKYKEVHRVRWLSFYSALETVYRTINALLAYLAEVDTSKDLKAAHLQSKVNFVSEFTFILHSTLQY